MSRRKNTWGFHPEEEFHQELQERYELSDHTAKTEFLREIVEDGLHYQNTPLYVRLGLPKKVGAQLEDRRRDNEDPEDVVVDMIERGFEAERADTIDAIGGSDELRHLVDLAREEGEDRPDAVRRLLREGVRSGRPLRRAKNWATFGFLVLFSVMILVTILPDRFAAWGGGAVLVTIAAVSVQFVRAAYWWLFGEGAELRAR